MTGNLQSKFLSERILSSDAKYKWAQTGAGIIVPNDYLPKPKMKAFDFFAGCGGFSLGLHQAGWHVIGACEIAFEAAHTYMHNLGSYPINIHFDTDERKAEFEKYLQKDFNRHIVKKDGIKSFHVSGSGWISHYPDQKGCEHFWIADIRALTGKMILKELRMEVGELDLVCGGPPCQGFSHAGKRNVADPRNNLVFEFGRLICELQPKTLIMENVPGILTMETPEGINVVEGFCKILADGDYAPFESMVRSLVGRKDAKAIIRSEKKEKVKKQTKSKPTVQPKKKSKKVEVIQPNLF